MSAVMDAIEPDLSKQQHSTYIAVIESLLKVATPAHAIYTMGKKRVTGTVPA